MGNLVPMKLYCRLLYAYIIGIQRIGRRRYEYPFGGAIAAICNTTYTSSISLPARKGGKNSCQTVCVGRTASEKISVATKDWLPLDRNQWHSSKSKSQFDAIFNNMILQLERGV